jgi:membrane protein required for colicin V production
MSWLDIAIIIIILIPTLLGLKNGIIKAAFTIAGLIVGIILAGQYYDKLATLVSDAAWAKIVAYVVILIAVSVLASWAAALVKNLLKAVMLNWVNRIGGAVLGFVMGAFFCAAILSLWVSLIGSGLIGTNSAVQDSALAQFLLEKFPFVLGLLPSQFDPVKNFFQ